MQSDEENDTSNTSETLQPYASSLLTHINHLSESAAEQEKQLQYKLQRRKQLKIGPTGEWIEEQQLELFSPKPHVERLASPSKDSNQTTTEFHSPLSAESPPRLLFALPASHCSELIDTTSQSLDVDNIDVVLVTETNSNETPAAHEIAAELLLQFRKNLNVQEDDTTQNEQLNNDEDEQNTDRPVVLLPAPSTLQISPIALTLYLQTTSQSATEPFIIPSLEQLCCWSCKEMAEQYICDDQQFAHMNPDLLSTCIQMLKINGKIEDFSLRPFLQTQLTTLNLFSPEEGFTNLISSELLTHILTTCTNLTSLDISGFQHTLTMEQQLMFENLTQLKELGLAYVIFDGEIVSTAYQFMLMIANL